MPTRATIRRRWTVRGQVQGVGFRPFVYRLASSLGLSGFVRNDSSCVIIEAQGTREGVDAFAAGLVTERPALAKYQQLDWEAVSTLDERGFQIVQSHADGAHRPVVTVDTAVCPDCLREMRNPADFRFGYGLINCTNCGPRFSIIHAMPYDRPNTTMAHFGLCEKCHQQYEDSADRRFHAQPVACPKCGPKLGLFDFRSSISDCDDAIRKAAGLLEEGKILAIKGIGGFHLACRADDAVAVKTLRDRKKRDSKPFALMCANLDVAKRLVELSDAAIAEMTSPTAPIVLGKRRSDGATERRRGVAEGVASGTNRLGVMLPYTPIQHLLFAELAGKVDVLVMTSANLSDEPLVKGNEEAKQRLTGVADAILYHDRDIERCVDDSIVLDLGPSEKVLPIRRARGYVPQVISLQPKIKDQKPNILSGLCVGGELKNTVAVVRGDEIILSQHLGDLKHTLGFEYFKKAISDLCRLMEVEPQWIAHDLHPAYLSSQWAGELAKQWGVPLIGVQHHHAHAAAVLAEHGVVEPALAVVCDGVGYGTDGTAWGGELLVLSKSKLQRAAHLRPVLLPGADAASRDTRRCAAGLLWAMHQAGDCEGFHQLLSSLFPDTFEREMVLGMLQSGNGCVTSSAAGRVFDAVATILGVCMANDHEAQAPMALEALAESARPRPYTPAADPLDLTPFFAEMVARHQQGESAGQLAADFHEAFAQAWTTATCQVADRTGIRVVGLSGGVFCNAILTQRMTELLAGRGMQVLRHEVVPPNDGGIAFGQAVVAMNQLNHGEYTEARRCSRDIHVPSASPCLRGEKG